MPFQFLDFRSKFANVLPIFFLDSSLVVKAVVLTTHAVGLFLQGAVFGLKIRAYLRFTGMPVSSQGGWECNQPTAHASIGR